MAPKASQPVCDDNTMGRVCQIARLPVELFRRPDCCHSPESYRSVYRLFAMTYRYWPVSPILEDGRASFDNDSSQNEAENQIGRRRSPAT